MGEGEITNTAWDYFLPPHAIVMSSRLQSQPRAQVSSFSDSLDQVAAELVGCTRCKLCLGRKTVVVGEGATPAQLMFIGEAPAEEEDLQGRPFVGKAGQLLDRMIEAIGLKRADVYLANIVKCRPSENRKPEKDEVATCNAFLLRQIQLVQPKILITLGELAVQTLLQNDQGISQIRGKMQNFQGIPLMPTLHPEELLKNPESKKVVWQDLQTVAKDLGLEIPNRSKKISE